ncbi:hypothetical protein EBR78_03185 [bacterium]|nr:hypothetical protein [bacterium]
MLIPESLKPLSDQGSELGSAPQYFSRKFHDLACLIVKHSPRKLSKESLPRCRCSAWVLEVRSF